ncbi:hypothetical protein JFL47_05600 [Haemophilus haemoglobinophilus]|nr:hypothetical protein [Canicola haemoglobinophilus]
MIDFEKAYQELESSFNNQFISLYDLILMIRSKHPNLSDNKIASVLLDKFKSHSSIYSDKYQYLGLWDDLLTSEDIAIINAGDVYCCNKPKKLHEPHELRDKDDLFFALEKIEKGGIIQQQFFFDKEGGENGIGLTDVSLENGVQYLSEIFIKKSIVSFILEIKNFDVVATKKNISKCNGSTSCNILKT